LDRLLSACFLAWLAIRWKRTDEDGWGEKKKKEEEQGA
jgi:threonine/homoserine/homoserine lactone efflux protein